MVDIVPELYKKIFEDFEESVKQDKKIQQFLSKVEKETALSYEASLYANYLGGHAAAAVTNHLVEKNLPNGTLYWNIAERIIKPLMQEVHKRINDAAVRVMEAEDRKNGIGLKPVRAKFPEDRVHNLIDKVVELYAEGKAENGQ